MKCTYCSRPATTSTDLCDGCYNLLNTPICGDTVTCGTVRTTCKRPKGHPQVGYNNGHTTKYEFHRGDGYVWDERNAWQEGQEP